MEGCPAVVPCLFLGASPSTHLLAACAAPCWRPDTLLEAAAPRAAAFAWLLGSECSAGDRRGQARKLQLSRAHAAQACAYGGGGGGGGGCGRAGEQALAHGPRGGRAGRRAAVGAAAGRDAHQRAHRAQNLVRALAARLAGGGPPQVSSDLHVQLWLRGRQHWLYAVAFYDMWGGAVAAMFVNSQVCCFGTERLPGAGGTGRRKSGSGWRASSQTTAQRTTSTPSPTTSTRRKESFEWFSIRCGAGRARPQASVVLTWRECVSCSCAAASCSAAGALWKNSRLMHPGVRSCKLSLLGSSVLHRAGGSTREVQEAGACGSACCWTFAGWVLGVAVLARAA